MLRRIAPLAYACLGALALAAAPALAADAPKAPDAKSDKGDKPAEVTKVTHGSVTIDGKRIAYTATTGTLFLRDDKGEPRASVFYVAYTRDDVKDPTHRPITYTFNGGPGSSSVWLHLGAFGPRKVTFADAEAPAPAPYRFSDNADSLLDVTDLVFIDPVGTGFSRPLGDAKLEEFTGVKEDVSSVAEFIRRWTTRNGRWQSPKFLAGESYGTTRAAALSSYLEQREGIFVNGIVLVSSILNFETTEFDVGNDLPYIMYLPTYAATAWYHHALADRPAELAPFLEQARAFAGGPYAAALMKGDRLGDDERHAIAQQMARFIGISADYIERSNLRVNLFRFDKELLRDQRRTVGRLDSRFVGIDSDAAGEGIEYDPSFTAIMGPYTAALNDYVHRELGFDDDHKYEILSFDVNRKWTWKDVGENRYVNVGEDLRTALSQDPHLRVFVANGYYDMATPFFATEYTFHHLGLEPALRGNVSFDYFEAGHMMYVNPPSLTRLKHDVAAFIEGATR